MKITRGYSVTCSLRLVFKQLLAVCLLLLFSAAHAQTPPTQEVGKGLQWLASQVQPNGQLLDESGSVASTFQVRSEVVQTLQLLAAPAPVQLIDTLAAVPDKNTEYLARQIVNVSLTGAVPANEISSLRTRQNSDGGFGAAAGFESHALDTSWALLALKIANVNASDPAVAAAADYLRVSQRPNGAFSLSGNSSQYLTTAMAMIALQLLPRSPAVLDVLSKSSAFLLSEQAADGGWGNVAQTSSVYLALLGSISDAGLQSRVTAYLASKQNADGSWGGDAYVTALALRALSAQPRPIPTTGEIIIHIVDASTGQPVAGAEGALQGTSTTKVTSDPQGKVVYPSVPAGSYTLSVSAAGYAGQSKSFTLQAGTTVDLGVTALVSAPTSGILQGTVKDAATGAGLAGASISVTGSATASATSSADGSYSIAGLAPGAVVVNASKAGYASSGGSGAIVAGATLTFSPALQVAQAPTTTGGISGLTKDASSAAPLPGVLITVSGNATGVVVSLIDGSYNLAGLTPGAVTVTASKSGYTPVAGTGVVTAGGVLAFNPSLVADGQPPATTGGVTGKVSDSATGLALAGVTIEATAGSAGPIASATTGADGSYSLSGLTPGAITITAAKAGYSSVSGSGSVVAGALVLFSPALQSTVGTLKGQVVDATTNVPLAGVTVTVGASSITATTGNDGRFTVPGIAAGGYSVTFAQIGYATKAITAALVTSGAVTDLQVVGLAKAAASVSIAGKVTDSATFQPIAGATVTLLGTGANATTSSTGAYRLEGLPAGAATLRVSAVGYTAETVIRSFDSLGEYALDFSLNAGQGSSMTISNLASDQARYGAYAQASLQVEVQNSGDQSSAGTVLVTIQDQGGKVLESLEATYVDANGAVQRNFNFPAGITLISLPWDTKSNAPGVYTTTAKLFQVAANPVAGGSIELAAKRADFSIESTQALASAVLTPLPAFTNLGATERIGFKLDIVNRSNVPVTSSFAYQVHNPAQVPVYGSSVNVSLEPQEDAKSLLLTGFEYQFVESGLYPSSISATAGVVPAILEGKPISVAPGTRIDPSHSVTPSLITPDGDKRIRIDIRLQGVEQK